MNANTKRSLWWIADNQSEADQWAKDLTAKGCVIEKTEPHPSPFTQVDVVFSIDPNKAKEILGYTPGEEEWLFGDDITRL